MKIPGLALDSGPGEFTLVIRVIRRLTKMRSKSFEGMTCSIAGVLDAVGVEDPAAGEHLPHARADLASGPGFGPRTQPVELVLE